MTTEFKTMERRRKQEKEGVLTGMFAKMAEPLLSLKQRIKEFKKLTK